jgi:hypothetical protein
VYRLAPPPDRHGVVASYTGGLILFGPGLTRDAIVRRHAAGARLITLADGEPIANDHDVLFRVRADGTLVPVTETEPPPEPGDAVVLLTPPAAARPEDASADEVGFR